MEVALKPKDEEFPRAMDVHGLFSTEPDVFGGFTDVSPWVRGADKNADVTVFWREFEAKKGPGKTEALTGPTFDVSEGCAVAIHRFRDFLDKGRCHLWDERNEQWQSLRTDDIRPGMVVMLPRSAGGYSEELGWTGKAMDELAETPPPGRFSDTFEEDAESENAGWVPLQTHLADAKSAATHLADALQLADAYRIAFITAAELHDIGKAHRVWQIALPHSTDTAQQLWAKAPYVFILHGKNSADFRDSTERILTAASVKTKFYREEVKDKIPRQLWKVSDKIRDTRSRRLLSEIKAQTAGLEGWMRRFLPRPSWDKPCIRHEAASVLAAWTQYFRANAAWPGLTLFLVACHHGKVRTVLYARGDDGEDVCGVPKQSDSLPWAGGFKMDFSCAAVGIGGEFSDDGLTFTTASPGWTGLVADLLGGWEKRPSEVSPPLTLRDAGELVSLGHSSWPTSNRSSALPTSRRAKDQLTCTMPDSSLQSPNRLTVLPLPGLHLDSLGLCLSALGLLSLCSRRWASVRGGWRGAVFYLAGGPTTDSELIEYLAGIGERGEWKTYRNDWDMHQQADTDSESAVHTTRWRAHDAPEEVLEVFQSHLATADRLSFNPLFGTGGNAGRRKFTEGWAKATHTLKTPPKKLTRQKLNADLAAFLQGQPGVVLSDYKAGCWFGADNKAYNSGIAKPFRKGQISPWAMALACEAFGLFHGSTSRQLGSARRATGAFPFVTTGAAPTAAGEAGKNLGEIWLPVWEQPMSLAEVVALFQRGRAEVSGRGATTSPAFAAAILQRGVDAGIREFRRFLLLRTTSENTFESRLASVITVSSKSESAAASALKRMVDFRDKLPADRKKGTRWIYAGLRGPLDEALVTFAERPQPETAREAVDAVIGALRKADRNRGHRRHKPAIQFQQLPGAWAASLLDTDGEDCVEARIGLALATLFAGRKTAAVKRENAAPFLPYWLGVQMRGTFCTMPEAVPFRRVWGAGTLPANLAAAVHRRLIEEEPSAEPPFGAWHRVALGDIEAWLTGAVDDAEVECCAMRFSLFRWEESVSVVAKLLGHADQRITTSGDLALFALFKPLFQRTLLSALLPEGSQRNKAAKVGPLPDIVAQLARSDVCAAVRLARNAYRAVGIEPAHLPSEEFACADPLRLLAALLIPARGGRLTKLTTPWLSSHKNNNQNT
ncbi:MAG: type I-U CRISPR-associated protein Csx17 [Verrucomicrobiota bacterium]